MGRKTERRHQYGEQSRRRILDATFELANELGYEGTSIARVSERSGLPASSVYWHFRNKDALFGAVIEHSFADWRLVVPRWEPLPPGSDRRDHVRASLSRPVRSIAAQPEFWRLGLMLTLERRVVEVSARRKFLAIREAVLAALAAWWRAALPSTGDGEPAAAVPELLARFTMATLDGLLVAAQTDASWDLEALTTLLADALDAAATSLTGAVT